AAFTPWPDAARTTISTPLLAMRSRLGIAVRATGIRAVLLQSSRIEWRGAADFDSAAQLRDAIEAALDHLPNHRLRPRVLVALGPRWAMIRRVPMLTPVDPPRAATAVIPSHPETFLHHRPPLLIDQPRQAPHG